MSWLAERIEHWPIDKLIPYARNARQHSDAQIAQIAASIAEFGFTNLQTTLLGCVDGAVLSTPLSLPFLPFLTPLPST